MTGMDFQSAQSRYFESEAIAPTSRWIEVELPSAGGERRVRTQVLELGAGRPVVLLHGGGGLAAGWAPLMAHLPGCRLIAPDRPGGGLSDGFDYRSVDLRAHAIRWLEGVFRACELESAVMVANSMGARWATWFALAQPHRVLGIAALGIPAGLLDTSAPFPMRLLAKPVIGRLMMALEKPSAAQVRTLFRRMGHQPDRLSERLIELVVALESQPGYATTWRSLLGSFLGLGGVRPSLSLDEGELDQLSMPITIAVGSDDPFGSNETARRAATHPPDASFESAGTGHLPWLDEPARYAAIVQALLHRIEAPRAREATSA